MKKTLMLFSLAAVVVALASCGGKSSKKVQFSLDELDDFFTVKSYTIESNAKEKDPEHLSDICGTLTLVVMRNPGEMKYKPSDIDYAKFAGESSLSNYYIFKGDCDAAIKQLLKINPGDKETLTLTFKVTDPYNEYNTAEENQRYRQEKYDALTQNDRLDQILFDIEFKDEAAQEAKEFAEIFNAVLDSDDDDDD